MSRKSNSNELDKLVKKELKSDLRSVTRKIKDDVPLSERIMLIKKRLMLEKKLGISDVHGNTKYSEEVVYEFLCEVYAWITVNEDALFLRDYYLDPNTDKAIPYGSLKRTYGKYESCDELREEIKYICFRRLYQNGLTRKYDSYMTKFGLINNYGWKSERSEQDVTLSTKEVRFKFDNPELSTETKLLTEDEQSED